MSQNSSLSAPASKLPRLRKSGKPESLPRKPSKDFPLSIHKGTGYWCKKVKGRVHYFGKVADDPKGQAALEQWLEQKDDLLAGREPRARSGGLTVADLANQFLAHKEQLRDNGELNPRTFRGYYDTSATVVNVLGRNRAVTDIVPDNFRKLRTKLAKTRAAVALRNEMQRVRSIFKFAFDDGLILAPVRFGQAFAKPKLDVVRRERETHRAKHGNRMFEADELRLILDALSGKEVSIVRNSNETEEPTTVKLSCNPALTAMTLLAANCGFGQSDVSSLPVRAVDLDSGWIDFARVKTAVARRIPLWPETIAAIRAWLPLCPKPKGPTDAGLVFLTCRGSRWVKVSAAKGSPCDAVGLEFGKVIRTLGLKRPGVSFYAMRHGFETVAGETADQVAVDAIMGHVPQGMSAHYRERISDDRLRRVTEHVRQWLFPAVPDDDTPDGDTDRITLPISDPCDPSDRTQSHDMEPSLRLYVG